MGLITINVIKDERIIKVNQREKAPLNKNPALMKRINMDIWVVGTSN